MLRSVEAIWWSAWQAGWSLEEACEMAGVSRNPALAWLVGSGGLSPRLVIDPEVEVAQVVGARGLRRRSVQLTYAERQIIEQLLRAGHGFGRARLSGGGAAGGASARSIALRLGRAASTITREVARNSRLGLGPVGSGDLSGDYNAHLAQVQAEYRARRPQQRKLAANAALARLVQDLMDGTSPALGVGAAAGAAEHGCEHHQREHQHDEHEPLPLRAGRRQGCRCTRPRRYWSPRQIEQTLRRRYPDRPEMHVSHETIYQSLYVQGRGGLRADLHRCLRTGRGRRVPNARSAAARVRQQGPDPRLPGMISISERPAEVEDRAVPGHWEGDLIIGAGGASAIGTLVERSTGFCMLLHLPEHHGAEQVRDAMVGAIASLPQQLWRSLTWDRGREMARHAEITTATDLAIYFADPHSPWQRGTNENTNGLLRQYFPKGEDLSVYEESYLQEVAAVLNERPRQRLDFACPAQALNELLLSA